MAQQTINNGDSGLDARTKINSNFTETYAKQDVLVSGTNIKTINGSSLLGSGDLALFSGLAKITVGTSAPGSPTTGDLWIDTN